MGKGKKKGQVQDDWENEMEEIAAEATGDAKTEAKPQPAATVDDLDAEWASDDEKKKKKGKKGKSKKNEPKDEPEGETEDNQDDNQLCPVSLLLYSLSVSVRRVRCRDVKSRCLRPSRCF
jgi:hypothetical protein